MKCYHGDRGFWWIREQQPPPPPNIKSSTVLWRMWSQTNKPLLQIQSSAPEEKTWTCSSRFSGSLIKVHTSKYLAITDISISLLFWPEEHLKAITPSHLNFFRGHPSSGWAHIEWIENHQPLLQDHLSPPYSHYSHLLPCFHVLKQSSSLIINSHFTVIISIETHIKSTLESILYT